MNEMNITSAQYQYSQQAQANIAIAATIDDVEYSVPISPGNRHYDEIMRQVAAGDLTILDAD